MTRKRKASGDAPGTSLPPARMRAASTDGDDVSHGGDLGSGGERKRVEVVVPTPQPLATAGIDANLTDNSGRIARAVDEEASSPSGNGEELAAAAGKPQPPPADQTVEAAEAPQPLPNDERKACEDAPEPSQARREAENDDDSGDSTTSSYRNLLALQARVAQARARVEFERDLIVEFMLVPTVEQEEVSSSMRPVPSSAWPSGSEEQLAAAAAARALASRAADHRVNQPADAEAGAQPVPRDDESVGSAEPHR